MSTRTTAQRKSTSTRVIAKGKESGSHLSITSCPVCGAEQPSSRATHPARPGGRFGVHHDWDTHRKKAHDRRTSFFATLAADESRCGSTSFPFVKPAWGNAARFVRPWCSWLDCEYEGSGVTVKPIKGNALFWVNFKEDGTGVQETLHAAEPLLRGTKVGMDGWTWAEIGAEAGGLAEG